MKWLFNLRIFLFLCLLAPWLALAMPPTVLLGEETTRERLEGSLELFNDQSSRLRFAAVASGATFRPLGEMLSLGFVSGTVWLRGRLEQTAAGERPWLFELENPLFDEVHFYLRRADGRVEEQRAGEEWQAASDSIEQRKAVFRFTLQAGESAEVSVAIRSRNAISSTVSIWQPDAYHASARTASFTYGVIFGVHAFLVLFHTVFWRVSREPMAGWYVAWVLFNLMIMAITIGYWQMLTGLGGRISDTLLGLLICLGVGMTASYSQAFLSLKLKLPRIGRTFVVVGWVLGGIFSLPVLADHYALGVAPAQALSLVYMVILIGLSGYLIMQGDRAARFFAFSFSLFWAAVALRYLRNLGLLPPLWMTEHAIPFASLLHMIIMSFGITGKYHGLRRQHLEAQQVLASSLETQVRARTVELEAEVGRRRASEEEAQRALAAEREVHKEQQDFVAMVSHEFRTPLAIIDAVTQGLARSLTNATERDKERCQDIRQATRRMYDMMDEYLTLERMGGAMQAKRVPCEVAPLVSSVVEEFESPRLHLSLAQALGEFSLDPGYFRTALRNLLANALRHTPQTGQVHVSASIERAALLIRVSDEGPGIPPDELPKLFDKYFRGRKSQLLPGAGLGLYLAARIAAMHDGRVEAENRPEGGLLLTLRFFGNDATTQSARR